MSYCQYSVNQEDCCIRKSQRSSFMGVAEIFRAHTLRVSKFTRPRFSKRNLLCCSASALGKVPFSITSFSRWIIYAFLICSVISIVFFGKNLSAADKKNVAEAPLGSEVYRDTAVTYRNIVTARSFSKSADLTYNPYYAMQLDIAGAFRPGRYTLLLLDCFLSRELTNSDVTTKKGEIEAADIFLHTALRNLREIPLLGIQWTPSFRIYVPSSLVSQARTMIFGLRAQLAMSKQFKVMRGLTLYYTFWIQKDFHEYTTASIESPLISTSSGATRSEDSFFNTGLRNVSFALSNYLGLDLYLKRNLGIKLGFAFRHAFLYSIDSNDPRISYEPLPETDVRYQMLYHGEIFGHVKKMWTLALGFLTENQQLSAASTYEAPFFNRHTAIFFDIRLDIAETVNRLSSKRRKK